MPQGRATLPGDSICTISDASHVKAGVCAAINSMLVTPVTVRRMLLNGASLTALTSISGDSGCPDVCDICGERLSGF